ncbi:uncharacterized protein BX663DRAFT_532734 [Cokeromyces recurvatus]|uniref:uncharacterized protein n=1 Tax=Cokeromyces recurvatus TaxID=90255 RepID=UPI00221FAE92|nr:uncharacterized protein BX663DRAFT_532734 [Cokeromyces recurvatus]KAI7899581.1 hypothetical protein BX663DRAFT_532734 [Cokeromyces recurvatus]
MNQISSLGVNHKGFNRLLSVRFYSQMIRSPMEYGLAICALNNSHFTKLEACQNECIRRIFGGSARSSTKVMLHLVQQPSMTTRATILQAKYLIRSMKLPDDTLLNKLLPHLQMSSSHSQWYKLTVNPLWRECAPILDELDRKVFKRLRLRFQKTQYENLCQGLNSKLIRACRPNMIIDPILWLPMTNTERSQVLRWRLSWRLSWLPGGIPRPCPYHPSQTFGRTHSIECLQMHHRLQMPRTVTDPLSFLLNQLPTKKLKRSQDVAPWTIC